MYSKESITIAQTIWKLSNAEREKLAKSILTMNESVIYSNQDFDRVQDLGTILKPITDKAGTLISLKN